MQGLVPVTKTRIRRAEPRDLHQLQEIARRTIDKCYRPILGDEAVDWFIGCGESDRELARHLSDCHVLLQGERILGFTIYFDDLIHLVMIDVGFHRTGIGTRLLTYAEDRPFRGGHSIIRLETFEANRQALNFYLKNGWSLTGMQRDEDSGPAKVLLAKRCDAARQACRAETGRRVKRR